MHTVVTPPVASGSPAVWSGSIVRILRPDEQIVGAGFLFNDTQVLTCAHVVADALGARADANAMPTGKVQLDFPLVDPGKLIAATVTDWRPMRDFAASATDEPEDVAVLTLDSDAPERSQPAPLLPTGGVWNQNFGAFGFPPRREDGVWADGVLRASQARRWIQIEDRNQTGYFITHGFSGTPVLASEGQGVLGMVVGADQVADVRAAYMIPAGQLMDVVAASSPPGDQEFDTEPVPAIPAFFGRQADVNEYRQRLRRDRFVLIRGQVGVGKTALGARLARDIAAADDRIFWFTFDLHEKKTTEALWWCLAGFLRRHGRANLWRYLRRAEGAQPVSLELTARMNRLLKDAEAGGFVFGIDDVHLSGADSDLAFAVELLSERYTGRLAELPVHFILMGRDLPASLAAYAGPMLSEFSLEEARTYIVQERHIVLPDNYLSRLVSVTGGNPKLIDLSLPTLTSLMGNTRAIDAFLDHGIARDYVYVAKEMYGTLTEDERTIVKIVAIFEKPVEERLVEEIARSSGATYAHIRIDSLLDRRLLLKPGPRTVSCPSPLREYSNHIMPSHERVALHNNAAEYYERNRNYLAAAYHFRCSEVPRQAVRVLVDNAQGIIGSGGAATLLLELDQVDETSLTADEWSRLSRARGDALRMRGSYESALAAYRVARDAANTEELRLELECEIGSTYERLGKDHEALDHFRRTLMAGKSLGNSPILADAMNQIGWANYRLGRFSEAMVHLHRALELAQQLGDARLLGQAQERLGMVALAMNRHSDAQDYLERSISTYRRSLDPDREARARANLGMVYGRQGDRAQQLEQYRMVETIFEEVGDRDGLLRLYNNMGYLLSHDLQDHRAAIPYYEKLRDLAASIKQQRFLSVADAGLAECYLGLGDTRSALECAAQARTVAVESKDLLTQGLSWRVEGGIRLQLAELDAARRALRKSMQLLSRAQNEAAERELSEARSAHADLWKRVRQAGLWRSLLWVVKFAITDALEAIKPAGVRQ